MKICSIASGSSGNCIYIGSEEYHILIDAGISKKRIEEGLAKIGVEPEQLDGIFITHEHSDHISGIGVFSRKYKKPVFGTKGTLKGVAEYKNLGKMPVGLYHEVEIHQVITLGDLEVEAFRISHDANQPSGFKITCGKKSMAIATDLGCYDQYTIDKLGMLTGILLEANHDTYMLEVGNYPYYLKKRVLSTEGHLSNELSGKLLCDILHKDLKVVILGHLSKENNYEELAYETVKLEVNMSEIPFNTTDFEMVVAKRDEVSDIIEL